MKAHSKEGESKLLKNGEKKSTTPLENIKNRRIKSENENIVSLDLEPFPWISNGTKFDFSSCATASTVSGAQLTPKLTPRLTPVSMSPVKNTKRGILRQQALDRNGNSDKSNKNFLDCSSMPHLSLDNY